LGWPKPTPEGVIKEVEVVSWESQDMSDVSMPEWPAGSRTSWVILLKSAKQVGPQVKWVRLRQGKAHGSVLKF
jgi:hypothetical protein